jgi:arylsulfatase A-like enzyme/Flp pilus assembly protein TadD
MLLTFAAALSSGVCSRVSPRAGRVAQRLSHANVLLITIDTLRADRLGSYGNRNGLTPALDALAREGIRFSRARAHVPMTLPAHASILTGLTPRRTGVRNNTTFRLDASVPTVATFLKQAGYRTGAFIGSFVLDSRFGLAHDFDVYDDRLPHVSGASFHFTERRANEVLDAALTWIGPETPNPEPRTPNPAPSTPNPAPSTQNPAPSTHHAVSARSWFAWIHLFDPHAPYDAPPEYRAGRSAYDAEVAYTDAMIGAFLNRLRASGQLERTLVVVTGDHGESLGEHGESTHGLFAYDSTLAVPLILNAHGLGPAVIDGPVVQTDIVPTILDFIGVPAAAAARFDGHSALEQIDENRAVYFEALDSYLTRGWAPLRGVVQQGWKYIDLPEPELYELSTDPEEQRNRSGQGQRGDVLRKRLIDFESGRQQTPAPAALDAEATARLRSLGYVAGSDGARDFSRDGARGFSRADDPKHLVALNERFNTALTAFEEGRANDALAAFLEVLEARPDFLTARTSAASVLVATNRAEDAVRLLRDAPADEASSAELLAKLGSALRSAGDLKGAAATLERARETGNRTADVVQDLAVVYAQLGRVAVARTLFEQLTTDNPSSATAWYNRGLFELQSRRPDAAAKALRIAVERDPTYVDAWNGLGAALASADPAGALDAWSHAERLLPHDYDLLFNVAMLAAQSDHPADAVPYLRRFVAEAPRDRYGRDIPRVQQLLTRLQSRPR